MIVGRWLVYQARRSSDGKTVLAGSARHLTDWVKFMGSIMFNLLKCGYTGYTKIYEDQTWVKNNVLGSSIDQSYACNETVIIWHEENLIWPPIFVEQEHVLSGLPRGLRCD